MDILDLHAWAQRHRADPELHEIAETVTKLIAQNASGDYLVSLCRDLCGSHPGTAEWWTAYRRLQAYIRTKSRV